MVRKIPVVLAVLALTAVGLAGCATPGASSACERPADADPSVTDLISVSGEFGAAPTVDVYTPFRTDRTVVSDVVVGEGPVVTTDAQVVVLDLTIVSGATGETLVASPYSGDLANAFPLSQITQAVPALTGALRCAAEGSRTVVALAPGDIESAAAASLGMAEGDSAVAVVDLQKVYLAKADGADVFNSGFGLPSVVRAPDGTPGITIPDSAPPARTVVQTIEKGTGEVVTGDRPVRVNYTGATWEGKEVFDTTWGAEPASMTLDSVVPGFAQALEGQTVGSQVLVVVAPEDGYGDQAQGSIPAGSTLVFVIDILGLDAAP